MARKPTLKTLKAKAKKEGWHHLIKTRSDEQALLDGYFFSWEKAEYAIRFFSHFRLKNGKPFELLDWQRDITERLFGWVKEDEDGRLVRRHRRLCCFIGKKNAKSFYCSLLCLYMLIADGEPAAEIVNVASSTKQADIIFKEAVRLLKTSPRFKDKVGYKHDKPIQITPYTKTISIEKTFSKYYVLSSNPEASEGFDLSCVCLDELHRCKRDLFDSLYASIEARPHCGLHCSISTAGIYDPTSVGWQEWEYMNRLLSDEIVDVSVLPVIYAADPADDPYDEETWYKANPALGKTITLDGMRSEANKAKEQPLARNNFLRRRLNVWVKNVSQSIDPGVWDACNNKEVDPNEWPEDAPIFCGLDMSHVSDITALALLCEVEPEKYEVFVKSWVPEESIADRIETEQHLYHQWITDGWLSSTPGKAIKEDVIVSDTIELLEGRNLVGIAADPALAKHVAETLKDDEGYNVLWQKQGYWISEHIKAFESMMLNQQIEFGNSPLLTWCATNVTHANDSNERVKFLKNNRWKRIDPIIAIVLAIACYQQQKQFVGSYITFAP